VLATANKITSARRLAKAAAVKEPLRTDLLLLLLLLLLSPSALL